MFNAALSILWAYVCGPKESSSYFKRQAAVALHLGEKIMGHRSGMQPKKAFPWIEANKFHLPNSSLGRKERTRFATVAGLYVTCAHDGYANKSHQMPVSGPCSTSYQWLGNHSSRPMAGPVSGQSVDFDPLWRDMSWLKSIDGLSMADLLVRNMGSTLMLLQSHRISVALDTTTGTVLVTIRAASVAWGNLSSNTGGSQPYSEDKTEAEMPKTRKLAKSSFCVTIDDPNIS